ncbi:MAG: carbohydrate binding domain-containing protein, partial [Deltaproteobacteria bacterium]|nr:carbohydrate binding domain-containing protein [Deltaproteobacteria bacterium]
MRNRVVWLTAFFLIGFIVFGPSHAQEVVNLLVNGGFEDGVAAPWGTYGGATIEVVDRLDGAAVDEDPIEGNFCLHVVVPAAGANYWDIGLNQGGLVFEAGKTYTLSVFLKCKEGTLDINFKPELAQDPWTALTEQSFTMTEEWTEISLTPPAATEDLSPAEIVFHVGYAPGEFWIDGIRWYEGDYVEPVFKS